MKKVTAQQKKITDHIDRIYKLYPRLKKIIADLAQRGGIPLLVGGAVRDLFLKIPVKDIDIEVHNLDATALEKILQKFGHVRKAGKVFGVLRIDGLDIDWSLPRSDSSGRKPQVTVDPFMGYQQALIRRDLTINAMAINMLTSELIDPFEGLHDLKKKILRAPDEAFFQEDPLRFFRVMQFIGRFQMFPDKQLEKICAEMDISTVSKERIEEEFAKLLLKSKQPSLAIKWLDQIKRLQEILPELAATKKIKQNPQWHPEGDVFEHTMQTIDAMARIIRAARFLRQAPVYAKASPGRQDERVISHPEREQDSSRRIILMYAALCHDLGKVNTTKTIQGKIVSYGHEITGEKLAKTMLKRIMNNKTIIDTVCKLVRHHMQPLVFVSNKAKMSAYKRLALKLSPETNMEMLAILATADHQGRNPKGIPFKAVPKDIKIFIKKAESSGSAQHAEEPILKGRDLQGLVPPGPKMGKLLKKAYEIQIDEGICDKEVLKKRVL